MDPYVMEKEQGNRYAGLTEKIVIQLKRKKNKRLIDSE